LLEATNGVLEGSGKWLVLPQAGQTGFDDPEETRGGVFSIPQWQTLPLQHGQTQWLEAADADAKIQPLLWVNG
jgi:hypothetical protein